MKMTKEQEILNYMAKLKISREEAEELWNDDNSNALKPEVKAMETKAKENGIKRRYEQSTTPRKTTTRERKVDETKKRLLKDVKALLEGLGAAVTEVKTETEITFNFNGDEYSFKLTKHRTKTN